MGISEFSAHTVIADYNYSYLNSDKSTFKTYTAWVLLAGLALYHFTDLINTFEFELLCCLMTPGLSKDIQCYVGHTLSMFGNHQLRHCITSEMGSQPGQIKPSHLHSFCIPHFFVHLLFQRKQPFCTTRISVDTILQWAWFSRRRGGMCGVWSPRPSTLFLS